jgi:hypothetical protein
VQHVLVVEGIVHRICRALLNLILQLLNLIRQVNKYNSATTWLGLVVMVGRVRVGASREQCL